MSTDDAATANAAVSSRRSSAHRALDVTVAILLLAVHALLFVATMLVLGMLVMGTDPCGGQPCGDPAWVDRAIRLGLWAGIAIFIADLVVTVSRLARRTVAFFVPIIGCVAQLALGGAAAAMESLAGPV